MWLPDKLEEEMLLIECQEGATSSAAFVRASVLANPNLRVTALTIAEGWTYH